MGARRTTLQQDCPTVSVLSVLLKSREWMARRHIILALLPRWFTVRSHAGMCTVCSGLLQSQPLPCQLQVASFTFICEYIVSQKKW
jgi:hypothetical protein